MKKDTHTDGYLHILKYISLFGGVQGLNVLIGVVRNKFVAILLGPQESVLSRCSTPRQSSSATPPTLAFR